MSAIDVHRPAERALAGRGWAAFRHAHRFGYNVVATRFWLVLALCGGLSMAVATWQVARLPPNDIVQVVAWMMIVALAAAFPVAIPRTRHSIAVGDVFVFLLLALYGAAPAALAAALAGGIACMRSSARVSSRIATPATAALAMYASLAMHRAKGDGKGRLALFDTRLTEQLGHKLQLEADLRRAIGEGQLALAYQPLFQLEPYRLCGFEALARWVHPVRGAISPGVFITLAEETGCIEALTRWAVDEAVRQHAAWCHQAPYLGELVMHVNASGKDLAKPEFVPNVRSALEQHGLPARQLVLEITESTLMEHREVAMLALAELRALGVKLGIDDFGTGYSSLAYLSTLPFDCLKIDRSFVIGTQHSAQNVEIVRTVVSLGRSLNKDVVAEGIETHEQLQRLKQLGATIGQGHLLARPLNPLQVGELLTEPAVSPA